MLFNLKELLDTTQALVLSCDATMEQLPEVDVLVH